MPVFSRSFQNVYAKQTLHENMLVEVQKVKTKRAFILKKINIYMKMLKTTEIEHYNLTIKIMSSRFISRDS